MQPDASVGPVAVHGYRMVCAVNPDHREAQTDPVFAERIVGAGIDLVFDVLAVCFLFTLNRRRHAPSRILAHLDYPERTGWSSPLPARLSACDRIRTPPPALPEFDKPPLRHADP